MATETQTQITRLENAKADIITAIENKGVLVQSGTKLDGIASLIDAIPTGGGGTDGEDAFVTRTLSATYENSRVTEVGAGAFAFASITSVDMPNVTTIGERAFYEATLASYSLPNVTTIGTNAFYETQIVSAIFPNVVTIPNYAFNYCSKLKNADFPEVTTIGSHALAYCPALLSVNFPKLKTVGNFAFTGTGTTNARFSFPSATKLSSYAFSGYRGSYLDFPKVTVTQSNVFNQASNLTTLIFRAKVTFSSAEFSKCYHLASLYLVSKALCVLSNSNAFTSTIFAGYSTYISSGKIYVPSAWVASYRAATNWTYFSSFFSGLTDAQIAAL